MTINLRSEEFNVDTYHLFIDFKRHKKGQGSQYYASRYMQGLPAYISGCQISDQNQRWEIRIVYNNKRDLDSRSVL